MKTIDELGISPTPWSIWNKTKSRVKDSLGNSIADCGDYIDYCVADAKIYEARYNASLIAAAPELYEALRKMQECFDYIRYTAWFMDANFASIKKMTEAQNKAKYALAKAIGEEIDK